MRNGQAFEMSAREVSSYEFDDFRLDVKNNQLFKGGEPISLTNKAFQILLILVQNAGETVDKEHIYEQLWGDSFVEDANLTQHIYVLRKTLGPNPAGESYIETVSRQGYRFHADVKETRSPASPTPTAEPAKPDAESEPSEPQRLRESHLSLVGAYQDEPSEDAVSDQHVVGQNIAVTEERNLSVRRIAAVIAGITVLGLIAVAAIVFYKPKQTTVTPTPPKSIAVLPFKPIGEESANEKMGLGMADAIITRLSKLRQIPVRPTSAVASYTDQPPKDSRTAGKAMGVDSVLEGTVQLDAGRVRVSVQLINVQDGNNIWAENFDENYTNIFNVQDSISARVVQALEVNLTSQQKQMITRRSTINTDAYQAYQMGVYYGTKRNRESLENAVAYFQKAIELDPNYAEAYAMLADSYNMQGYYGYLPRREVAPKANKAAAKAIELNPEMAEAYIALAFLQYGYPNGRIAAKQLLEKAIALSPYNSTAHVRYGWALLADDLDATVREMRLAQEYDPLSPLTNGALCNALTFKNAINEALPYCEKSVELDPALPTNRLMLADAYFLAGRSDEAIAQIKQRMAETEGSEKAAAEGCLGYYLARLSRKEEAEEIFGRLKVFAVENPGTLNDLVLISYALGRPDEGFSYFQQAFEKSVLTGGMFRNNPIWEQVRADKRTMDFLNEQIAMKSQPSPAR